MAAKLCNVCNIRRPYTGSKGGETAPHLSELCNYCYEEGGWENSHSDSNHNAILDSLDGVAYGLTTHKTEDEYNAWLKEAQAEIDGCWICHPSLNLAKQPKGKGSTGPKKQNGRRPQLNHKGHSHPQTPAARRACKLAFWTQTTVNVASTEQLFAAMQAWNHSCDGNGKTMKPATWHVVPEQATEQATVKATERAVKKARAKK